MQVSSQGAASRPAFATAGARPFLVGVDDEFGDACITVHAARHAMTRGQARQLKRQLRQEGIFSRFRVKRYGGIGLDDASSLEAFLAPFKHDQILYDPTGAFERVEKLVNFARVARRRLANRVVSLLWHRASGTIYVVLAAERAFKNEKARKAHLADVSEIICRTLRAACGPKANTMVKGVKIGFALPRVPVTPIDKHSLLRDEQRRGRRAL